MSKIKKLKYTLLGVRPIDEIKVKIDRGYIVEVLPYDDTIYVYPPEYKNNIYLLADSVYEKAHAHEMFDLLFAYAESLNFSPLGVITIIKETEESRGG